jgi:hypothetical protein
MALRDGSTTALRPRNEYVIEQNATTVAQIARAKLESAIRALAGIGAGRTAISTMDTALAHADAQ